MELEETEMEMKLLKGEHQAADSSLEYQDLHRLPFASTYTNDENRLQQIKDEIQSIEKLNLRKEIVAHRQQKLQMRRARQQFLKNAALREAELLQKIDRFNFLYVFLGDFSISFMTIFPFVKTSKDV